MNTEERDKINCAEQHYPGADSENNTISDVTDAIVEQETCLLNNNPRNTDLG